jgi:hypothetical protein
MSTTTTTTTTILHHVMQKQQNYHETAMAVHSPGYFPMSSAPLPPRYYMGTPKTLSFAKKTEDLFRF